MKIAKTFKLDKDVAETLAVHAKVTGRTQTQLVERAINRCYGKEKS